MRFSRSCAAGRRGRASASASAPIPRPTSPSTPPLPVEAALEALPSIGASNVTVTVQGAAADTIFTVTFTGALAGADVPQILASQGTPRLTRQSRYWVELANVGPDPTSGPITLTIILPAGLTRHASSSGQTATVSAGLWRGLSIGPWSCPGSPGQTTIICTTSGALPRHTVYRGMEIRRQRRRRRAGRLDRHRQRQSLRRRRPGGAAGRRLPTGCERLRV